MYKHEFVKNSFKNTKNSHFVYSHLRHILKFKKSAIIRAKEHLPQTVYINTMEMRPNLKKNPKIISPILLSNYPNENSPFSSHHLGQISPSGIDEPVANLQHSQVGLL